MSRNIEVVVMCDGCDNRFEESEVRVLTLTSGKKSVLIDVCDNCFLDEWKPFLDTGRRPEESGEDSFGVPCTQPGCESVLKSKMGLGIHLSRAHGIKGKGK